MLEDTSGVQGKEPFIFPHYLDANIIVLEIWYKQLSFHKDMPQKTVWPCCYQFHYDIWFVVLGSHIKQQI